MKDILEKLLIIIFSFFMALTLTSDAYTAHGDSNLKPDEVIAILKAGNDKYKKNKRAYPNTNDARRKLTAKEGQKPYVTILGCSDSRVPLEHIFDAGIGDLFVVRVAGNVADTDEIGSMEYGVEHLGTPVLLILGHSACGAVTAVTKGESVHGSIPALVDNIIPAVKKAKEKAGKEFSAELVNTAIELNVWQSIEDVYSKSEILKKLDKDEKVKIIGAIYNIEKGDIQWLGEHPARKELLASSPHKDASSSHASDNHSAPVKSVSYGMIYFFIAAAFLILLLSQILFVSEKRIFKKIQIKGRIYAAFAAQLVSLSLTLYCAVFIYSGKMKGLELIDFVYITLPVLMSAVFIFVYIKSIINSFRKVITALKNS